MVKFMDSYEIYNLDEKGAKNIEKMLSCYGQEWQSCMQAHQRVVNIVMEAGLSPVSLYIFHCLTEKLIRGSIHQSNVPAVLVLLSYMKVYIWSIPKTCMDWKEELRQDVFCTMYFLDDFSHHYFDALCFRPEDKKRLEDGGDDTLLDVISDLCTSHMFLLTYSIGLPSIYDIWQSQENRILHTICGNCGQDLRAVLFEGDKSEAKVEERVYKKEEKPRITDEWDIFENTYAFAYDLLERVDLSKDCSIEDIISKIKHLQMLSRFYGTRKCKYCGREGIVADTYMNWWRKEYPYMEEPTESIIKWLNEKGNEVLIKGEYSLGLFYFRQALCYTKNSKEESPVLAAECYNNISMAHTFFHQFDMQIFYAKKAVEEVEKYPEDKECLLALGESYRRLGVAYTADFENMEKNNPKAAMECFGKAKAVFDKILGEHNEKSELVEKNIAASKSNTGYGREEINAQEELKESIKNLQGQIDRELKKENINFEEMANNCNLIADLYANGLHEYEMAYQFYERYITYNKKIYGEESEMVADCYEFMGEFHEDAGDDLGACQYYEMALAIHIKEIGKVFFLPSFLKKAVLKVMDVMGKMDREEKFCRCISASDSCLHVGEMYVKLGLYKKAVKTLHKSITLREWEQKMSSPEKGYAHMLLGDASLHMENRKNAKVEYIKALHVYHQIIEDNRVSSNPLYDGETKECEEQIEVVKEKLSKF